MRKTPENRIAARKDDMPLFRAADAVAALILLTRLPMPRLDADAFRGAPGAWAYPLAGAVVGALMAGVALVAAGLGAPLAAALAVAAGIVLTGAMHEDGLADSCDGLWGGTTPQRRLEIMRDSRIGTYGVLALALGVLLRWLALSTLIGQGAVIGPILIAAVGSRAGMVAAMAGLSNARQDGLSHAQGRPHPAVVGAAVALALIVALLFSGWDAIPLSVTAALATLAVMALARRKLGGQTGDILGATQQVTEIALLLCLVALS